MSKKKKDDIKTNSKGYRKNYKAGVVGWQVFLVPLRWYVNLSQHARAIGTSIDMQKMAVDGIKRQEVFLEKQLVKIPSKLSGRRTLALKNGFTQEEIATSDFFKSVNKFIDLVNGADVEAKKSMVTALTTVYKTLKASGDKIPSRLTKRLDNIV